MIVSVSRRTDIPAFYNAWFSLRLREGLALSINPMNPRQVRRVPLTPDAVDLLVFWSKNPAPFSGSLDLAADRGFRSLFFYTLNGYPRAFEPRLPSLERRIDAFLRLAERLGPERVVWRYDPIILSNITPPQFHADTFGRIAEALSGATQRVIISFLDVYPKVQRRLDALRRDHGVHCHDARTDHAGRNDTVRALAGAANAHGMHIQTCAESADLAAHGIHPGACLDRALVERLASRPIHDAPDTGQRAGCRCVSSVDIGVYDTCRFKCAYCYATSRERNVVETLREHDPHSPALVGWPKVPQEQPRQLSLWQSS